MIVVICDVCKSGEDSGPALPLRLAMSVDGIDYSVAVDVEPESDLCAYHYNVLIRTLQAKLENSLLKMTFGP
jgi:hypothetical protein